MPRVTVEINVPKASTSLPIVWRLGRLYNVVANIREARVTSEYGVLTLELEGSTEEVDNACNYLRTIKVLDGEGTISPVPAPPEESFSQVYSIQVRLSTVFPGQSGVPILSRVARDYRVIVNIDYAELDQEDGGTMDLTLSGALLEVQRSIAYLHTTGLSVSPRQRSVSDNGNL